MSAFGSMHHLRQKTYKVAPEIEGQKESVEPMTTQGPPMGGGRGSLCQSGLLIAGLKLTLASLGETSEGEQELTLAFSTEGAHRRAAPTATDRSTHPSSLNCSFKVQSSGRSVQLAVLGGVPVSIQGRCLPLTKTTHRRDIPEMGKTAKAHTNVHSGLNATLSSHGNVGHTELLHSLGLFTTSPYPNWYKRGQLAWTRTFRKVAMPERDRINPESHGDCGTRHGVRGQSRPSLL